MVLCWNPSKKMIFFNNVVLVLLCTLMQIERYLLVYYLSFKLPKAHDVGQLLLLIFNFQKNFEFLQSQLTCFLFHDSKSFCVNNEKNLRTENLYYLSKSHLGFWLLLYVWCQVQRSVWPETQSVTFHIVSRCFENKNNNCCGTKICKNAIFYIN